MKFPRRQFLHLAAGAAALPVLSRITWAQAYPITCPAMPSTKFIDFPYDSDNLRIAAYLYAPEGEGPFPVVIYNHGDRDDPRRSVDFKYIGDMLSRIGYVVLIPERRGYGKSEGNTVGEEIGSDTEEKIRRREEIGRDAGEKLVRRLEAEATDVLNAIPYLEKLPNVDMNRLSIMGWSYGGIVTLFAASQKPFHAAIAQAPASQIWDLSAELQMALKEAARRMKSPVFISVAENDRTTAVVDELNKVLDDGKGVVHFKRIYQHFEPHCPPPPQDAPGHAIFRPEGMPIWKDEVLLFLSNLLIR
jgi:dienelactone hydrolase